MGIVRRCLSLSWLKELRRSPLTILWGPAGFLSVCLSNAFLQRNFLIAEVGGCPPHILGCLIGDAVRHA